jgi:hypothetical protein
MRALRTGERESQVLAAPVPSMSNAVGSLRSRVALSPRNVKIALVDIALIGVFVLIGEVNHGINPTESPLRVLGTFAPFLIGWVVVSVFVGAYRLRAFRSAKAAASVAGATWISAALLGQLLRGTALFHGDLTLAFMIVSILVGLALLVPWRVLVAVRCG